MAMKIINVVLILVILLVILTWCGTAHGEHIVFELDDGQGVVIQDVREIAAIDISNSPFNFAKGPYIILSFKLKNNPNEINIYCKGNNIKKCRSFFDNYKRRILVRPIINRN